MRVLVMHEAGIVTTSAVHVDCAEQVRQVAPSLFQVGDPSNRWFTLGGTANNGPCARGAGCLHAPCEHYGACGCRA